MDSKSAHAAVAVAPRSAVGGGVAVGGQGSGVEQNPNVVQTMRRSGVAGQAAGSGAGVPPIERYPRLYRPVPSSSINSTPIEMPMIKAR